MSTLWSRFLFAGLGVCATLLVAWTLSRAATSRAGRIPNEAGSGLAIPAPGAGVTSLPTRGTVTPSPRRPKGAWAGSAEGRSDDGPATRACGARHKPPFDARLFGETLLGLLAASSFDEVEKSVNGATSDDLKAALGEDLVGRLEACFDSLPPRGRGLAAWILAHSAIVRVSGFLSTRLQAERDPSVRVGLLMALHDRRDEVSTQAILRACEGDPSPDVRAAAAYALIASARRDPSVRDALSRVASSDASASVRAAAARALGMTPSPEATRALVHELGDPSPKVREAAAAALGGQQGFASDQVLAEAAQHESDPAVQAAMQESVLRLTRQLDVKGIGGCIDPEALPKFPR